MNKIRINLVVLIMLMPCVIVGGYTFWVDYSLITPWEHIVHDESEADVIARLGRPSRITGPTAYIAWETEASITANGGKCVKEFWYVPFSVNGEAYTVGFDAHGKAVSKFHYSSP